MKYLLKTTFFIFYRDIVELWRDKIRVVAALTQPFLWTLFFGLGFSRVVDPNRLASALNIQLTPDFNYFYYLYPGVIAVTVMFAAVSNSISLIWDREFGFLKEILVSPAPRVGIALGKIFAGTVVAAIQGVIMIFFGSIWYKGIAYSIVTFPFMLVLGFMMAGLGLVVSSLVKSTSAFINIVPFLVIPLAILSGAFFPIELTPGWMVGISRFNPVFYGVDLLRRTFLTSLLIPTSSFEATLRNLNIGVKTTLILDVLIVLGVGLLFLILGSILFSKEKG